MPYTQKNRDFRIKTPLGEDKLFVVGLNASEQISQLFRFQLDLIAENQTSVSFENLIGKPMTVELVQADQGTRYFNGICCRFGQGERDAEFTSYTAELVPEFWLLTRTAQSRIFQHISVPNILKKVLDGFDVDYQIEGTFHPRDFCVQYRETDFNFACRLMEEEGMFFYFEHKDGSHQLVIANTPSSHPSISGKNSLVYENISGGTRSEARIFDWQKSQELRSGKYALWDHCFELPHKHLDARKNTIPSVAVGTVNHDLTAGPNSNLEIYDYPGEYAQRFDGVDRGGGEQPAEIQKIFEDNARTVGIRMQEEAASSLRIVGSSNCHHLCQGHKFNLERHVDANGEYVLTAVSHSARLEDYRSGGGGGLSYSNSFSCIPSALPYRPPRITVKPIVPGTQTAVVVGPAGEEIFTDKYGRVKVQFHWDREGKNDADSSCWIRVGQLWAGRRWGASFWPRIGQEVIVAFVEGDPDQPIIVGSVYNADQMPPYQGDGPDSKHARDNKVSGVKSNSTPGGSGYNEIRFDDTSSKEQVFIHGERNMDVRVKASSMENVGGSRHLTVGGEKDGKKGGDQCEMVFKDKHLKVHRNHVEHVGGDMQLLIGGVDGPGDQDIHVKAHKRETVDKDDNLHVKGSRKENIGGGQSLSVGGSQEEKVGTKHALEAGQEIHLKAGVKVIIEAGTQISLKVGGSFIDINPGGVAISGPMVLINSGGSPGSGSGASPAGPQDAKDASPTAPTPADDSKTGQKSH